MFNIYCHKTYSKTYLKFADRFCNMIRNNPQNRFKTKLLCQINGFNSILQYPKNKKIPDRLIYEHKNPESRGWFTMFDKVDVLGWMRGEVMHITKPDFYPMENYDTYFIHRLNADTYGINVGSDFIKFAKKLSIKNGCEGRICLVSANSKRPPHIFYRKMGFDCQDTEKMDLLDKLIEKEALKHEPHKKIKTPQICEHWVLNMFLKKP